MQTGEVLVPQPGQPPKVAAASGTVGSAGEHRVPAHAAWFDYRHVADVERRSLPEFFDGRSATKTSEVSYACDVPGHLPLAIHATS